MKGLVETVIKLNHRVTFAVDETRWDTASLEYGSRRHRGQDGHRDGALHRACEQNKVLRVDWRAAQLTSRSSSAGSYRTRYQILYIYHVSLGTYTY